MEWAAVRLLDLLYPCQCTWQKKEKNKILDKRRRGGGALKIAASTFADAFHKSQQHVVEGSARSYGAV
jgi:hypothetical protein